MKHKRIISLSLLLTFLLAAVPLTALDAGATAWEQTSASDFGDGGAHFVDTSSGTLKLTQGLTGIWRGLGESSSDNYGWSLASAGDVNGDGYDDVIVGALYNDGGGSNAGEVYVYHGSASGPSATPDWSDQGEATIDNFGYSVAAAGDVNGDGYNDVIVGAPYNGGSDNGEAYVYHGSASGLSTTPDWSDQGEAASDLFGYSVAGAGDVNGDGYDDVIVGAYGNDGAGSLAGEAYVYHGSASGLSATPDWDDLGEAAGDYFGYSVAGAGDVNGDGYDDIVIGANQNDGGGSSAGEAYVYHGSSSGPSATPDWSDQGESASDFYGWRVSGAGDVNGDGYDDVIASGHNNDGAGTNAGEAYVYHGSSSGLSTTPDWSAQGESASDYFSKYLASAGDINGDGYDDVIVGAYGNDDAGSSAGEAYVYHGSVSGLTASPTWSGRGEAANDNFGYCVSGAGDVNGDGYDDVIVGARTNDETASNAGAVYVYSYGVSAALPAWTSWSDQGEAANDYFGYSVASAGDVNGDGYEDVIVGAYKNDDGPGDDAGEAYVYHGSSSGLSATPDWSDQGEAAGDYFGFSVAGAGDINGDGYGDVIIGARYNDGAGSDAGEAYLYFGSSSGLSATPDWSDEGEAAGDYFGRSVAGAGDVNGDGYNDVIVGATGNDGAGSGAGEVYVYHGSASGLSATPDWSDEGEASGDSFGFSVAGAGDVNGDGYDDIIVGATGNDGAGSGAGEAYVYHGFSSGLSTTPDWSDQGEAASDSFGWSVAGAGDVNGDGYDDVIVGAPTNDGAGSDAGEAYVYHGKSADPGLSATPDWSDEGEAAGDYFGCSVAGAGDVNGDGYDDVIVSAFSNDDGGIDAGEAYVYHGFSSGLSTTPDWSDQGEAASDSFGWSVAGAGDVNGDGYDDVIVGAYGNDGAGSSAGEAYVYHGSGYVQYATYESASFNVATTDGIDWLRISWNPTTSQPSGTAVKAQIGTSEDGSTWTWRGPGGTSSTYYTSPAGQVIYTGDRTEFVKVRLIFESNFGAEPGDGLGDGTGVRTPSVTDFSVEYRRFLEPSVSLLWPNGGENLMHGESYAVTWAASGDLSGSTPVALEYSLNAGSSWTTISSATANDGHYLWTLPANENVERALVRATVTALDGSTVSDTSDATFSIDPPQFWQTGEGEDEPDSIAPLVALDPLPASAEAGVVLEIRATASDDVAVTAVALRYRLGDGPERTVALEPLGGGQWAVALSPGSEACTLWLTAVATDGTNTAESAPASVAVAAAGAAGPASGGGFGWSFVVSLVIISSLATAGAALVLLRPELLRRRPEP